MNKIYTLKDILPVIAQLKKNHKKIVTYNGSFDLLHIGHIQSIHEAKTCGDMLVIGINSDLSIQKYKGPKRPIISLKERMESLAALHDVDYVVPFDEINSKNILDQIKPDIHCNGSDWGKNCVEREVVEKNGGKIHILHWKDGFSTTKLIQKIIYTYTVPSVKAVFIDRDGTINHNKKGYIHTIEEFEFLPGVLESLKKLSHTDYKIIIVSNQSGIGRGYYTDDDFTKLNDWMLNTLKTNCIRIDKVYYCPHAPEEKCSCRKPNIGMLLKAVSDYGISLNDSWVIGDTSDDIIMGREANVKTIKLGDKMPEVLKLEPNIYLSSLTEAIDIILKQDAK